MVEYLCKRPVKKISIDSTLKQVKLKLCYFNEISCVNWHATAPDILCLFSHVRG